MTDEELMGEVLRELISDGYLHPNHDPDCGCPFSRLMKRLGEKRCREIIASLGSQIPPVNGLGEE
jgi:hypothetical protein